ncbi:sigma-70 family RNA polymerase sigma factor [Pelotomaculum isophthalicicum JI]|uniref:Sigma-70 family RNA polymerase sigma factor n=1 Tax=Pelotomaculum isophthalicicum JI TaxID=947010 RepID=A0A9X4GZ44_9FIRM|nr:sigma-70 family RNA polymerase sigma factor [Pelotomaculum isophthalicicum]MDF9408362.1 sigma-70 family RNA polymerase sigma factor [Pelotomaculum isophthalicicum JI]
MMPGIGPEHVLGVSFEELYDLHFDAVNRYLRYRISSSWDADDLTAAVFLKALENFHKYRGDAPFAVWLFRIAHNAYVDYLRGRRERPFPESQLVVPNAIQSSPEEELLQDEEVKLLRDMLGRLPPEQRDVVSLRYAGELRFGQIAQVLGKTEPAVRMIHYRALKALRNEYFSNREGGERIARENHSIERTLQQG